MFYFRLLFNKHEELKEKLAEYDNFKEDFDIVEYVENDEIYLDMIKTCLKNQFQKLAM